MKLGAQSVVSSFCSWHALQLDSFSRFGQSPKCPTKFRILDMLWPPSSFEFYCNFDIAGIFSVVFSLPGSKKLEGLLSWLGSDWLVCCDVIHSSCVWPVTRHWAVTWVPICELELFQCSILIIMRDDLKKKLYYNWCLLLASSFCSTSQISMCLARSSWQIIHLLSFTVKHSYNHAVMYCGHINVY